MVVTSAKLTVSEARDLATAACLGAGASAAMASSLVDATMSAAQYGQAGMGFPHLFDYLQALEAGRIRGDAEPTIESPLRSCVHVDAHEGIAQLGFDRAFSDIVGRARECGIVLFTQKNSFTVGELGYYGRRLADQGLVSLAGANGPALMTGPTGKAPVFCTNPLAFVAPVAGSQYPLVVDQASSATAFVNVMAAAAQGRSIPSGWALDAEGLPTTDPKQALTGALLAFGGYKGANIAMAVEVLSAGLSGSLWSLDSPHFHSGDRSPKVGMSIIAIAAVVLDLEFTSRLAHQIDRLRSHGLFIPGIDDHVDDTRPHTILIDSALLERLQAFARRPAS